MGKRRYGAYKVCEDNDEDIKKKLIELISAIDLNDAVPDWNTIEVIYHACNELNPLAPPTIAVKFETRKYKEFPTLYGGAVEMEYPEDLHNGM